VTGLFLLAAALAQSRVPAMPDDTTVAPVVRPEETSPPPVAAPLGRRQSRDDEALHIKPMSRLATRIDNRLQTRIQTRIAGSQPDMTAAYKAADDQSRRSR
jgi:hypothetical protein